eukprot:3080448-Amphidinium_carterae.1
MPRAFASVGIVPGPRTPRASQTLELRDIQLGFTCLCSAFSVGDRKQHSLTISKRGLGARVGWGCAEWVARCQDAWA